MYIRVVRFEDADPERVEALVSRIQENEGPPEGVPSSGVKVLHDESQRTAVVLGTFETEEDMRTADAVLDKMDAAETPGARATVDRCEVKIERDA